jgi:hypothetical protein
MKIFLLIGQSNMAGPHISQWVEEDDKRLEGVMLLNASDEFEPASNPLNKYSTIKWQPFPGINPGVTFVENIKTVIGDTLGLVSNSRGSSKIQEWQKGERYYEEAVRRTKNAMKYGELAGILWLQGEDNTPAPEGYAPLLEKFIKDIRKDLGNENLPFIACEIMRDVHVPEKWSEEGVIKINEQIHQVIEKLDNCEIIDGSGVMHVVGDEVHFAPEGMRALGRRYAHMYIENWLQKR